jgi:plasmid stabilization system protein ParE
MKRAPLDVLEDAVDEARAAYQWYLSRSRAAGTRFMEELDRGVGAITQAPERWPAHLHGTRRYLLRRFPYALVYTFEGGKFLLVAVAHGSRRPGYWRERLP